MRRIASILLLALLLFNWFGYRLVISFLEGRANTVLQAQLDENNYDESQLVSIKIPVRYLSYYNSSVTFERVDGQVEINGTQYRFVKRRIYRDSMEMLCIPNHEATKLNAACNEFFKFSNDLQQDKKPGSHPSSTKNFVLDSYTMLEPFGIVRMSFRLLPEASPYAVNLISCYSPTAEHPPDIQRS